MKTSLGFSLLLAAALPASAEPPRDSLHPGTAEIFAAPDERGMTLLRETRRRAPFGLLYPYPPTPPEFQERAGWQTRGALSVGALFDGGDEDETRFERYADRDDGALLDLLNLELVQPERGDYALVRAGSVGRGDAFYELSAGRAGWLRLRASHSGVPHRYASDAVSLYDGVGGDRLLLPAPLVPGASADPDVAAALAERGDQRLEVQRDSSRASLRFRLRPDLAIVGSYGLESRHGEIPSGVGFTFPEFGAGVLEIATPVDDRTQDVRAGLEWGGEQAQLNLGYHGSFYANDQHALALEQPFVSPITEARLAVPPDNQWHDVRTDFGVALPLRGRLKSTVSWSTGLQNENLLPPTTNAVTLAGTVPVDLSQWNGRAALSQGSAEASVDHLLVDVDLYASPWRPLRLRAGFRHSDQDTDTDYVARNPLTNEYGYIVEDGGHGAIVSDWAGVFQPGVAGSNWRYRTIPFGAARNTWELGATYSAPLRSSLDLRWQQEDVTRDVSERRETRERRLEATLGTRGLSFATARLGFADRTRDGGRVDYDAYAPYYTQSLPGFTPTAGGEPPHNLSNMVRPDLADVRGQRWHARVSFALGDRSDLVLSGRLRSDDFGPDFGLTSERMRDVALEWSVQPSPRLTAYTFLSADRHERAMGNIRGFAASSDPSAGGPNFPFDNGWRVDSTGDGLGWGGGLTARVLRWLELDSSYTFLRTRDELETDAASAAAAALGVPEGRRLPALRGRDHVVQTSLRIEMRSDLCLRLFYRYERSSLEDFHQTGLPLIVGRRVFFGHEDADYEVSLYGIAAQMRF